MLQKKDGPDGLHWVRDRFDAAKMVPSPRILEFIATWRGYMSFADLLVERGGPFAGTFELIDRFERDGRSWARFRQPTHEYCFDVEITPDGEMGDIVPVPPEEAWRIALERDARLGRKVVVEE